MKKAICAECGREHEVSKIFSPFGGFSICHECCVRIVEDDKKVKSIREKRIEKDMEEIIKDGFVI